jgi:hypothetical protein
MGVEGDGYFKSGSIWLYTQKSVRQEVQALPMPELWRSHDLIMGVKALTEGVPR